MTIQAWLIYLTLVFAATSTPGPAVLFITTHAALHGWKKAVFAALGNITGLFCLGVVSITGLGTILKTSELLFAVIRYAGAAYLIYLGVKMLSRQRLKLSEAARRAVAVDISAKKIFFQALGVALSNPKAIVFLTALFPQFVDIETSLIPQFAKLIATLMAFSFAFLMSYALLAHKAKVFLTNPNRVRAVSRVSGSIFIFFGVLLAVSSRR